MVHLIGNTGPEECRGRVDVSIYAWAEKGGKRKGYNWKQIITLIDMILIRFISDELKGLDFKKQLISIKKKWLSKPEYNYNLLVLGANDKFVSFSWIKLKMVLHYL